MGKRAMKSITSVEFQGQCLQLIKQVCETGVPIIITDDGQPIAQLGPVTSRTSALVGAHRGKIRIVGDIMAPIDEKWEAER